MHYKNYESKVITHLNDILNINCQCVDYKTLNEKYDIKASFLDIMQLRFSLPIEWKGTFKQCSLMPRTAQSVITVTMHITFHVNYLHAQK